MNFFNDHIIKKTSNYGTWSPFNSFGLYFFCVFKKKKNSIFKKSNTFENCWPYFFPGMDLAHTFLGRGGRGFFSHCFSIILLCFYNHFIVTLLSFCVVLHHAVLNEGASHYITSTFAEFFCYLDKIYIDLLNIRDFFINASLMLS